MSACVYRCLSPTGDVLYIGCTITGGQRLAQHRSSSAWWSEVGTVEIQHFASKDEALLAEAHAIREERPAHNRLNPGIPDPAELAERRRRREEALAESARRRQERLDWEAARYQAPIVCTNCGRGRDSKSLWTLKGVPIPEVECGSCGLKAYKLKAEAAA